MYGYWFGMSFIWWIIWAAVIVAFFAFLAPVPRGRARPPDAIEILKRRYASGEITTAEFEERRARLLDAGPRTTERSAVATPVPPRATDVEHRTQH